MNGELIGNLGNFVNRTLTFLGRYYDGTIPEAEDDAGVREEVNKQEAEITAHLERAELRDAFRKVFALSSFGNKAFQDGEPWKTRKTEPEAASRLIRDLVYLVRDLAILVQPYIPETSSRIGEYLGLESLGWEDLGNTAGISLIAKPEILFKPLEDELIAELKTRFSGSQKERQQEAMEQEKRNAINEKEAAVDQEAASQPAETGRSAGGTLREGRGTESCDNHAYRAASESR